MGAPTIPAPTESDFKVANVAMDNTIQSCGLDPEQPEVIAMKSRVVAVHAQMSSEIRWLRNIMHENVGNKND